MRQQPENISVDEMKNWFNCDKTGIVHKETTNNDVIQNILSLQKPLDYVF